MPTVSLKAHYDGERIVLDEPFDLPVHSPLIVTVLPAQGSPLDRERVEWSALALQDLSRAYGEHEPEYTIADLKEPK
jgi:hypothetical protein